MSEMDHSTVIYSRKRKINNQTDNRELIIELCKEGASIAKIASTLQLSGSYVNRIRWEEGLSPNTERIRRGEEEEKIECKSLEPELLGEKKRRYKELKRYRDFCFKNNKEWTIQGLKRYLRKLHQRQCCCKKSKMEKR